MRVAGLGFRQGAPLSALLDAVTRAGGEPQALASIPAKCAAPQMTDLAATLGLPVIEVPENALENQPTLTRSDRQFARFGTGSLAEAAALAAAGPGARLTAPRAVSACGQATAAIAEGGTS